MKTYEKQYNRGVYPTMITPYRADGTIDCEAVRALVRWYHAAGCDGIFASCQSSEIWFLNEDERVLLASLVTDEAARCAAESGRRMTVVASGHVSEARDDQIRELTRIAETGVDSVIFITNRFDIANTSDDAWIADAEAVLAALPADTTFGLYECPHPYKRLLTPTMLRWAVSTGRCRFIKDTCCAADEIAQRMDILRGTDVLLFNANAQTLLPSLKSGAAGYCGVMANFHPALYARLWALWQANDARVASVADFLSLAAFTESLAYPCTAKYFHATHGVPMALTSRSRDGTDLTPYHKMCVEQMTRLAETMLETTR